MVFMEKQNIVVYNKIMNEKQLSILPSLLASDFSIAEEELKIISESGCDYVHLDVMDGHFVPSLTFGPKFISDIRKKSDLIFDTHLMIDEPENSIKEYIDAGSDIITIHCEATKHIHRALMLIKESGVECGIALNPGTPISSIEEVLPYVNYVLVMSVNPGWGGQKFIKESIIKIQKLNKIRQEFGYEYQIEVDGGINKGTSKLVYDSGANMVVMGTSFFQESDKSSFIEDVLESL